MLIFAYCAHLVAARTARLSADYLPLILCVLRRILGLRHSDSVPSTNCACPYIIWGHDLCAAFRTVDTWLGHSCRFGPGGQRRLVGRGKSLTTKSRNDTFPCPDPVRVDMMRVRGGGG